MVHKLRKVTVNRDGRYTLEGMIELEEGYFTVESLEVEQEKGVRGRGSAGKQNIAVKAESTPLEDADTAKKSKHVRYFKAKVLETRKSGDVDQNHRRFIRQKKYCLYK